MMSFLAVVWGASFLLIAIGLDAFTPGMVAWLRLIVAVLVLSALPAVRRSVDRRDWPAVAVVSIAGNAGPALLFAYAEQTIESSLAGMLNAAVPLATASIAFVLGMRSLRRVHVIGLVLGFAYAEGVHRGYEDSKRHHPYHWTRQCIRYVLKS